MGQLGWVRYQTSHRLLQFFFELSLLLLASLLLNQRVTLLRLPEKSTLLG